MNHYLDVLRKYSTFEGRSGRKEFWMFFLFNFVIAALLSILSAGLLCPIYGLLVLIPSLALSVRRLHDIGRSGWWNLLWLLPLFGFIALVIFWASEEQMMENRYGARLG